MASPRQAGRRRSALALVAALLLAWLAEASAQSLPPQAPGARLLVYQGNYGSLGRLASVASRMARFDVVVLERDQVWLKRE